MGKNRKKEKERKENIEKKVKNVKKKCDIDEIVGVPVVEQRQALPIQTVQRTLEVPESRSGRRARRR